jgi:hypothetical protein
MSTLVIGATVIGLAVLVLSTDPEFIKIVKEIIYQLVLTGYGEEKIIYIMTLYA